jgi:hypothetical protein
MDKLFDLAGNYYGIDWAAMSMTFFSLYYLGGKKRYGFIFGIMANISWMIFGIMAGSIANPIANTVFIILNLRGFINWNKKKD